MEKVIVGIHGLSNKPDESQLYEWWLGAVNAGLKTEHQTMKRTDFELAYWAELLYENPDPDPQPYTDNPEANKPEADSNAFVLSIRNAFTDVFGSLVRSIDSIKDQGKIDELKNSLRKKKVRDLGCYYDRDDKIVFGAKQGTRTRDAIRETLKSIVDRHQDKDILVIAHSMGSIVAYDVLRDIENSGKTVSRLVTIGSPLALEDVKGRIREERGEKQPLVPLSVAESWINFADPRDLVAADLTVKGEYDNSKNIRVEDVVVQNGYRFKNAEGEWEHNYHKSYGYLQTPELSKHVGEFLKR